MPIATHDAAVPVLVRGLTLLSDLLDKGERLAHAERRYGAVCTRHE